MRPALVRLPCDHRANTCVSTGVISGQFGRVISHEKGLICRLFKTHTNATLYCCAITSDTRTAYGSLVWRHGSGRAFASYHAKSRSSTASSVGVRAAPLPATRRPVRSPCDHADGELGLELRRAEAKAPRADTRPGKRTLLPTSALHQMSVPDGEERSRNVRRIALDPSWLPERTKRGWTSDAGMSPRAGRLSYPQTVTVTVGGQHPRKARHARLRQCAAMSPERILRRPSR